ncbi:AAA family ATPase [Ferrovibrio sp.]|uniref:AAA family ATPase n=1 Tax=Ferrovibrio sp. TaxID=1917215 RepID=UPI001B6C52E8|nr:AAA family ATPase [Ferrovibrio sp.]MBP7064027.1 AAA family ATPase [Ferrovibrio sp.]
MQFTKLRLSGFKSFVEPTEFVIHPGLTGVVGPNGCGKSNLVEALRWVMGENSAKRMRGAGMDDMIFAGTATRPARNVAEVALVMDNKSRTAPAAFNDHENLEIVRRIERERGSDYRINGQDVRARDVQLFFADLASGANSPAMVSQGRVGAIINAKPTDRRMLLEEAAGISGLHSRRHEAELRLKAAESNLERVVDVIGQLDQQLQGLKRQARQASRYRNIAGQIRRTEAMLFHLRHTALQQALAQAEAALHEAERAVADRTLQVSEAHAAERIAAEALPPLRQAEAEAGARLHRLAVARDGLDAEEARAREAAAQVEQRLEQINADAAREQSLAAAAAALLQRLAEEGSALRAREEAAPALLEQAEATAQAAQQEVTARQQELDAATERAAAEHAERTRLNQSIQEAERRLERLRARVAELTEEHARLESDAGAVAAAADAGAEIEARLAAVEAARTALDAAEQQQAQLVDLARATLDGVESDFAGRIEAARAALETIEAEQAARVEAARAQLGQIEAEQAAKVEAARTAMNGVEAEYAGRIEAARAGLGAVEAEHAGKIEAARAGLGAVEDDHAGKIEAARAGLGAVEAEHTGKIEAARAALAGVEAEHAEKIEAARALVAAAEAEQAQLIAAARAGLEEAEAERQRLQQFEQAARDNWQAMQGELTRLKAEEAGLARLLKADDNNMFAPVIDQVSVAPGFEKALGAALGDELNSAVDSGAPMFWEALPPLVDAPPLPEGVASLASQVTAPPALARRLSQIGIVEEADGLRLRGQLRQGQRLVSKSGALWRWDGFTMKAGAPTPASIKLEQRNRLADLREELRELEIKLADAQAAYAEAKQATEAAVQGERDARGGVAQAEALRDEARLEAGKGVGEAERQRNEARNAAAALIAQAERDRAEARQRAEQVVVLAERERNEARQRAEQGVVLAERERQQARQQAEQAVQQAERQRQQARQQAEQAVQQAERDRARAGEQGQAAIAMAERERNQARERGQGAIAAVERERNEARQRAGQALGQAERERQAARERAGQDIARAERELEAARARQAEVVRREAERQSRLAALADQILQLGLEIEEGETALKALAEALAALPPEELLRERIAALRQDVDALRQTLAEARAALEQMRRDMVARVQRLQVIAEEIEGAEGRAADAGRQLEQLGLRREEAEAELLRLYEIPAGIEGKRSGLLDELAKAETARQELADHLANAEAAQALAAKTARELEQMLGQGREWRVRAEAELEHQRQSGEELALRIREVLECAPDEVLKAGEVDPDEDFPPLPQVENRLERLRKERDNMGPVNLRADLEAQEVEEKLNTLTSEQNDLVAAIEKLRQGITSLNKEGRERLLDAFKQVDEHFQKLFVQVFGGGKAHLQLVESDDPLQAGLEIMASPPGKRLQVMSLLSGGEQALTALSLLFAVFLTNPAPICVLDEVDAPLDDSNVERLCNLMEAMARETAVLAEGTRFVVVTHHPITMARMDRLFGVTMAERGVSTLVSVDLAGAEAMRQTA